jgi:hypothetical protein
LAAGNSIPTTDTADVMEAVARLVEIGTNV